jgi:hypothetical protein
VAGVESTFKIGGWEIFGLKQLRKILSVYFMLKIGVNRNKGKFRLR